MSTVLITGGAGFIGGHLAEYCLQQGYRVRIIDDLSSGNKENLEAVKSDIEFHEASILDESALAQAAAGVTGIFHLAAIASVPKSIAEPILSHRVNSEAMVAVLEAAKREGARVVLSSSSAVYGESEAEVKTEDLLPEPLTPYAVQKLSCEGYLKAYHVLHGVEGFSLRYFNVFGRRQSPFSDYAAVVPKFIHRAKAGEDLVIFGDGSQTRDFVFVGDVVRANVLAMKAEQADGRALNIGTGLKTDLNELAQTVIKVVGTNVQIQHAEARAGDIKHSCSSNLLARKVLGFSPETSLVDGLASMVD